MNPCLLKLFQDQSIRSRLRDGLPTAFEMVKQKMPRGNPAIGILREHVIVGFFISQFGSDEVNVPNDGTNRSYDVELCQERLSIKTKKGHGGIKILWTADTSQAQRELEEYTPQDSIFLINIFENENKGGIYYIPVSSQSDVMSELSVRNYLRSATGTNNRGIEIKGAALTRLKSHKDTLTIPIDWRLPEQVYLDAWDEWIQFWIDQYPADS